MNAANESLVPALEGSLARLRSPELLATIERLKQDNTRLRTDIAVMLGLLRNAHKQVKTAELANAIVLASLALENTK